MEVRGDYSSRARQVMFEPFRGNAVVRMIRRDDLFGRLPDVGEVLRVTTGPEGWMMSWHCSFLAYPVITHTHYM